MLLRFPAPGGGGRTRPPLAPPGKTAPVAADDLIWCGTPNCNTGESAAAVHARKNQQIKFTRRNSVGLIVDHQGSQAPSAPSEPPSKFNRKTHSPHPRQKQRTLTAEPLQPAANIPTELTQKTSAHMPRRKPHSVRGASSHRDRTHLCAGACDLQSSVCASSASLSAPSARRCCCGHRGCVYVCVCP